MIIAGKLTTSVGSIIQWATITFDPAVGPSISFTTDKDGNYSYEVPAGTYRVFTKGKYDVNQKLLGEDIIVDATGTTNLESLLDRGIPSYTPTTLPDPATLGAGATVVVDGKVVEKTTSGLSFLGYSIKKNLFSGRSVFGGQGFTAAGSAYTFLSEIEIPASVSAVRVRLVNGGAASLTPVGVKFALAPTLGNDGTALTQVAASFSDAASAKSLPPSTSNSPATLAIPAADSSVGSGANVVSGGLWTDWAKISSIPRTDGVSGCILQVRVAHPAGATVISISGSGEVANFDASAGNLKWRANLYPGDGVTTTPAIVAQNNQGWFAIDAIEYLCDTQTKHVLEVGDSISKGQGWGGSSVGHINPGFLAAKELGIGYTNRGVSGRKQAAYIAEAKNLISKGFYTSVIIPVWTPNDNDATSTIGADWAGLLMFVNWAKHQGLTVGLRSAIPDVALNLAQDNTRKALNEKAKALAASDNSVFYIDRDSITSDGASPARQKPEYSSGNDGRHPNAAEIQAVTPMYKGWLSLL